MRHYKYDEKTRQRIGLAAERVGDFCGVTCRALELEGFRWNGKVMESWHDFIEGGNPWFELVNEGDEGWSERHEIRQLLLLMFAYQPKKASKP